MRFFYRIKSTKNMNIHDEIFKEYPDPTYLVKVRKLNRPLIEVRTEVGQDLVALAVLNQVGGHLKLCLIIVHPMFKNFRLGNNIIRIIINMFIDEFNNADVLYTVCPHQFNTDNYQNLLLRNGFQLSTIKANGDLVYTYAKSVQKSN